MAAAAAVAVAVAAGVVAAVVAAAAAALTGAAWAVASAREDFERMWAASRGACGLLRSVRSGSLGRG